MAISQLLAPHFQSANSDGADSVTLGSTEISAQMPQNSTTCTKKCITSLDNVRPKYHSMTYATGARTISPEVTQSVWSYGQCLRTVLRSVRLVTPQTPPTSSLHNFLGALNEREVRSDPENRVCVIETFLINGDSAKFT